MLGPAYNWRESEDGWFLDLNYGCVAFVKPMPADERGRCAQVRIEHFGKRVGGPAGTGCELNRCGACSHGSVSDD